MKQYGGGKLRIPGEQKHKPIEFSFCPIALKIQNVLNFAAKPDGI